MNKFKCDKCDGKGHFQPYNMIVYQKQVCDKCWGEKELDWIENIVGKPCPWPLMKKYIKNYNVKITKEKNNGHI